MRVTPCVRRLLVSQTNQHKPTIHARVRCMACNTQTTQALCKRSSCACLISTDMTHNRQAHSPTGAAQLDGSTSAARRARVARYHLMNVLARSKQSCAGKA